MHIYNMSIKSGIILEKFKIARVTPLRIPEGL
jgi:hypothetical protein